jgi:CO dehydrogenase/acetyl-CoA synthase gamma subunit (corrinoid Fe-S protein)
MMLGRIAFFQLRQRSLLRGVLLSLGALAASLRLAGFPDENALHASNWQMLVLPFAGWGMAETARCLSRKWSLHYAGVLILLYADLMILAMVLFLWLYL